MGLTCRGLISLLLLSGAIAYAQSVESGAQNLSPAAQTQTSTAGVQKAPCVGCKKAATGPIPDRAIYYFFIQHVGREDEEVQHALAEGKDTSKIRWDYGRAVNLREEEATQMLSLTLDGYRAINAKELQVQDGIRSLHERYTNAQIAKMKSPEDLKQLNDERWQLVTDTMANLKQALGNVDYQKLDAFIHGVWGNHVSRLSRLGSPAPAADPSQMLPGPNATKVMDRE